MSNVDTTAILNAVRHTSMNYLHNEKGERVSRAEIIRHLEEEDQETEEAGRVICDNCGELFGKTGPCAHCGGAKSKQQEDMKVPTVFGDDGKGVLHPESFGGPGIICHGPLVKQDGMTMAMRVVIHEDEKGEFAVHYQCFPNFPDLKGSYFHEGGYPGTNLARATRLFAERSAIFARGCGNLTEPTLEPV